MFTQNCRKKSHSQWCTYDNLQLPISAISCQTKLPHVQCQWTLNTGRGRSANLCSNLTSVRDKMFNTSLKREWSKLDQVKQYTVSRLFLIIRLQYLDALSHPFTLVLTQIGWLEKTMFFIFWCKHFKENCDERDENRLTLSLKMLFFRAVFRKTVASVSRLAKRETRGSGDASDKNRWGDTGVHRIFKFKVVLKTSVQWTKKI